MGRKLRDWRVAESLLQLRRQIDAACPKRNKASDGTIGDVRHAIRSSDHNPWVNHNGIGVVTAMDVTHDPGDGVDGHKIVEVLKNDPRVKYIIWNKRIYNPSVKHAWRNYNGANPHTQHFHISVKPEWKFFDDKIAWRWKPEHMVGL